MHNMFAAAKAKAPSKEKTVKKDDKPIVEIGSLNELANIRALIANLETIADTMDEEVKDEAFDYFVTTGVEHGRQPSNIRAQDGDAEAVIMLGKLSTRSPLTSDVVDQLIKAGVDYTTKISTAEAYVINPDYAKDSKMLEKVSKALGKVKDLPEDFITFQAEVSTSVTTAKTIGDVFNTKDEDLVRELLPLVSTMSVKPNTSALELGDVILNVRKILK